MEPTEPQSPESAQVPNTQQSATRYDADQIRVLEGMEAVRKRPAMYIGSTGVDGLHHLVYEVVDNCVDEHMAGFGNEIEVVLQVDGSVMVSDKGRGIPTGMHSTQKKSAAEVALTSRCGDVADGRHGVPIARARCKAFRAGRRYRCRGSDFIDRRGDEDDEPDSSAARW